MFTITPEAVQRIMYLNDKEGKRRFLRIEVIGGGCSGFQYVFSFVDSKKKDDHVYTQDNAIILIDPISLPFIKESTLHYETELMSSFFTLKNPKATQSCGCGNSFAIDL